MKQIFLTGMLACTCALMFAACGSETNVSINANGNRAAMNANSNGSTMGSMANSMGNGMNTMANTASNMTNMGNSSASSGNASSFVTEAAQGGMAEVEMGKLAAQKGQNPEVKKFGQMMVTDHTAANNELKAVAAKKNMTVPSDIGPKYKSSKDSLSKASGADFDKQYVDMMVSDHEDDVAAFEKQADSSTDPDVKAFAAKTLPTLKRHLDAIKALKAKMK